MVSRDAGIFQEEYLFGSFVRNPRTANDVDVLLIVRGRPGTKEWRLARTAVRAYITASRAHIGAANFDHTSDGIRVEGSASVVRARTGGASLTHRTVAGFR